MRVINIDENNVVVNVIVLEPENAAEYIRNCPGNYVIDVNENAGIGMIYDPVTGSLRRNK